MVAPSSAEPSSEGVGVADGVETVACLSRYLVWLPAQGENTYCSFFMIIAGSLKVTLTAERSMSLKPVPETLELRQVSLKLMP